MRSRRKSNLFRSRQGEASQGQVSEVLLAAPARRAVAPLVCKCPRWDALRAGTKGREAPAGCTPLGTQPPPPAMRSRAISLRGEWWAGEGTSPPPRWTART